MARFLDRLILFITSWWSNMPDPRCSCCGHKEAKGSTPTVVPVGFCHITPTHVDGDDADSSPHYMEPPRDGQWHNSLISHCK
ncbi:hypothetical protein BDA96_08G021500 [Sorghum bicolor]|uniref:Secreted protein n=1 Tax=Sorghum bicolor TaxID=4558 RepID=A0A921QG57_SORBI|nr:hypothetical protein BDA96_08G021500 [Sorghum bicolor]